MVRNPETFDRQRFYDSCIRIRGFIENLDLRLMECQFARGNDTSIPHEIVDDLMNNVDSCRRNDADGYISMWQNHIAGCESDATAIAEFEFPQITIDSELATPIHSISPTAHGYAANLLSFVYWDCWGDFWNEPRERIIREATEQLMYMQFFDYSTLSRVEARMAREQAIFGKAHDIPLSPQKQRRAFSRRLTKTDKKEMALAILIDHHRPFDDWNQTPLSLKQLIDRGLKNKSKASRAMTELFGHWPMQSYRRKIDDKSLRRFLQAKGEISLLGHPRLDDMRIADPTAKDLNKDESLDEIDEF